MTEVGEYGRTNTGKIFIFAFLEYDGGRRDNDKVILIENGKITNKFYYFKTNEKIVKHSKNIIDLIEDTDVLQVEISEEWVAKEDTIRFIIVGQTYLIEEIKEALENGIYKIKSIVTKEQFKSVEYEV